MFSEFDRLAMTRALALAERGLETTHPNPRVGCVLAKGDRIIGEGWHERAGEPHAEIMALRSAKEPVAGATAYVTLEPCSHHGRTPPCANALIEARIARVVFAVQDPNPRVSGQGADALLRAGITVEAGLMQNEATELNIGFMKRMKEGLPWVRVKLAMSLDGRTALANGASQWITGEPARADVQRWRARCSAVMTGVGTVLADDPQLNVRLPGFKGRQPLRVVLDARLRSPVGAKMFGSLAGVGAAAAHGAGVGAGVGAPGVAGATGAGAAAAGRGQAAAASGGAAGPAGVAKAGGVGGQAGAAAGGAARGGVASVAAGVATGVVGGSVLIFAAADGGFAASADVGRGAVLSDPSTLSDDMAELVSAFETSPTAVSARADSVAGPVSVKAEPRSSLPASAAANGAAPKPVSGSTAARSAATVPPSAAASGPDVDAPPALEGVTAAPAAAAPAAAAPAAAPAEKATEEVGVSPPVLAAAGDAAGAAPTSDDATWAGAALSGAIPVKREAETASNGATAPASPAASSISPAAVNAAAAVDGANGSVAPSPGATAGGNSATPSEPATACPAPAAATSSAAALPMGAVMAANPGAQGAARATPPTQAAAPMQATSPAKASAKADSPAAFQARKAVLAGKGVRIEEVPADEGFLDLFAVLKKLGDMEVNEVLVEAGPTLAGQLLTTFFVDELLLYVAPKLLGPQGRPLVNLPELQSLQDAWGFSLFDAKRFGDDLRLRMRPK